MSKTERDLTSSEADDALGAMFAAEDFESSLDEALDGAELGLGGADESDADTGDGDADADIEIADAEHESVVDDDHAAPAIDVEGTEVDDSGLDADLDRDVDATDNADDLDADDDDDFADDADDDDEPMFEELPEIILATPDDVRDDEATSREVVVEPYVEPDVDTGFDDEVDDEEVSDQILEELRRAEIDGPVVPHAKQDDSTGLRRRPRHAADYDPAPVPIPAKVPRVLGRKPRVRKVTRVVRHVDPWTVFKVAFIAHLVLYVTVLTASVLLWNVAYSTNTIDNVERFFESFGWASFEFNGGELYHAGWIAGLFVVIGLTGLAVLAATLFNLITDLVGGVRFTVLEEEVVETRTSPMRRFVVRRNEPEVPAIVQDGSGVMTREAVVDDTGANDRRIR